MSGAGEVPDADAVGAGPGQRQPRPHGPPDDGRRPERRRAERAPGRRARRRVGARRDPLRAPRAPSLRSSPGGADALGVLLALSWGVASQRPGQAASPGGVDPVRSATSSSAAVSTATALRLAPVDWRMRLLAGEEAHRGAIGLEGLLPQTIQRRFGEGRAGSKLHTLRDSEWDEVRERAASGDADAQKPRRCWRCGTRRTRRSSPRLAWRAERVSPRATRSSSRRRR